MKAGNIKKTLKTCIAQLAQLRKLRKKEAMSCPEIGLQEK
jgi:hypothetical protein